MGLDAYIHYVCPFRPGGEHGALVELDRMANVLRVMQQHGVPEVTFEVRQPDGVARRTIRRAEAEEGVRRRDTLAGTCAVCPVSAPRQVPGCRVRIDYPFDDVALEVIREALELDAGTPRPGAALLYRSLLTPGNDGRRMMAVLDQLGARPSPIGSVKVRVLVDATVATATPYAVLEAFCFAQYLDPVATRALREWYRAFYTAIGDRIADDPRGVDAASQALFGSSPSLAGLAALGQLVQRAEKQGLGLVMDG